MNDSDGRHPLSSFQQTYICAVKASCLGEGFLGYPFQLPATAYHASKLFFQSIHAKQPSRINLYPTSTGYFRLQTVVLQTIVCNNLLKCVSDCCLNMP